MGKIASLAKIFKRRKPAEKTALDDDIWLLPDRYGDNLCDGARLNIHLTSRCNDKDESETIIREYGGIVRIKLPYIGTKLGSYICGNKSFFKRPIFPYLETRYLARQELKVKLENKIMFIAPTHPNDKVSFTGGVYKSIHRINLAWVNRGNVEFGVTKISIYSTNNLSNGDYVRLKAVAENGVPDGIYMVDKASRDIFEVGLFPGELSRYFGGIVNLDDTDFI